MIPCIPPAPLFVSRDFQSMSRRVPTYPHRFFYFTLHVHSPNFPSFSTILQSTSILARMITLLPHKSCMSVLYQFVQSHFMDQALTAPPRHPISRSWARLIRHQPRVGIPTISRHVSTQCALSLPIKRSEDQGCIGGVCRVQRYSYNNQVTLRRHLPRRPRRRPAPRVGLAQHPRRSTGKMVDWKDPEVQVICFFLFSKMLVFILGGYAYVFRAQNAF